jgi:hypothetical protein
MDHYVCKRIHVNYFKWLVDYVRREKEREREVLDFVSDLSRLRSINVRLIKLLFSAFSPVLSLIHVMFHPIHQFTLRLSSDALSCSIVECTLVDFVGFVVVGSLG